MLVLNENKNSMDEKINKVLKNTVNYLMCKMINK